MAAKSNKQDNGTVVDARYVVTRSGVRVSDREYTNLADAEPEVTHWKKIVKRWPDGSKISVEEYNDKKHRIY